MPEDKKETKDEKPAEDKILKEDEKDELIEKENPEATAKEITDKEPAEKEADEEEEKAKAEKELAEKEATEKAEKKAKAKPAKKKVNKKRTKKKAVKEADDPKRVRMLMSIANEKVAYTAGDVYEVGKDITLEDAKKRLREGVAELDTAVEGPSETK